MDVGNMGSETLSCACCQNLHRRGVSIYDEGLSWKALRYSRPGRITSAADRDRLLAVTVVRLGSVATLGDSGELFTDRGFEPSGRQRHDSFDLEKGARHREFGHAYRGAGRRCRHVEIAIAQFAERTDILANIDYVTVDLNDVLHSSANGAECSLQVLECLSRLHAEVARRADELAAGVEAKLAGDMYDASRPGDLDHMGVSWRLGDRLRIDETDVVDHGRAPWVVLRKCVTKREMTRDETRGKIDLSLPIEGVKQRDTDLLRIGGQVIRTARARSSFCIPSTRDRRWLHFAATRKHSKID
jgi:hypothetical protein